MARSMSSSAPPPSRPDVSVVVRSMDRPELARALASIAAQDAAHLTAEVLVVAACGPQHKPVPPRAGRFQVRLVTTGERLDRPRAANAGLDAAQGRFVTFLDDDDEFLPEQFRLMQAEFAADPQADFVHARSLAVDSQGQALYVYGGPWVEWRQLSHGFFQLAGVTFKRELLERGVRFDERLEILEDLEFFVQCAQAARFRYLATPVSRYYVTHGTSGTGEGNNRDTARVQKALSLIREKWRELGERLDDSTPARLARAVDQIKAGDSASAVETLHPVLERTPDDVNALNLGGLANIHLARYDEAEGMLRRALERLPGHPGIQGNWELLERKRRESR